MRVLALVAGLSLLATAAQAQQQCYPNNPSMPAAGMHCFGGGGGGSSPALDIPPGVKCSFMDKELVYPCEHKIEAFKKTRQAHKDAIVAMMQKGQCKEAVAAALDDGDIDLAAKVKTVCEPAPAPDHPAG